MAQSAIVSASGVASVSCRGARKTTPNRAAPPVAARRLPIAKANSSLWPCKRAPANGKGRTVARRAAEDELDLDALLADLEPPALEGEPRYYQEAAGGKFEGGIAVTFGNEVEVETAIEETVALMDRSHWGRLRISGEDRTSFLHNQSTADLMRLQPGQGTDTVLVTAQARTIDIATAVVQEGGIMLIVSPGQAAVLSERFNKYIFPMDKVEVMDISGECGMLTIIGPESDGLMEELNATSIIGQPEGYHTLLNFGGAPVIAVVGTGLRLHGYTFIVDESMAGELWRQLAMRGAVPMGQEAWERVRVRQGCPAPGSELTDDYNPLEAGLYHAVSLAKGCYIGQETIAKVHNLNAVKQQLWGLRLGAMCEVGAEVQDKEGSRLGTVTSVSTAEDGSPIGMGYLRCKQKGKPISLQGMDVQIGGTAATVGPLAYASRAFAPESLPTPSESEDKKEESKAEAEAEQEAKAARLKAMEERLAAYQAQMAAAKTKEVDLP